MADGRERIGAPLIAGDEHSRCLRAPHCAVRDKRSDRSTGRLSGRAWRFSCPIAAKLAAGSQTAIKATKQSLNNWMRMAGPIFDNSLAQEMLCFLGADAQEGLESVRQKRAPKFPSAEFK